MTPGQNVNFAVHPAVAHPGACLYLGLGRNELIRQAGRAGVLSRSTRQVLADRGTGLIGYLPAAFDISDGAIILAGRDEDGTRAAFTALVACMGDDASDDDTYAIREGLRQRYAPAQIERLRGTPAPQHAAATEETATIGTDVGAHPLAPWFRPLIRRVAERDGVIAIALETTARGGVIRADADGAMSVLPYDTAYDPRHRHRRWRRGRRLPGL